MQQENYNSQNAIMDTHKYGSGHEGVAVLLPGFVIKW